MDAVKYVKIQQRICSSSSCSDCVLSFRGDCRLEDENTAAENIVRIVETWSAEHPAKTYKQDFFEKFPNADEDGFCDCVCREAIYGKNGCNDPKKSCESCWNEEMK